MQLLEQRFELVDLTGDEDRLKEHPQNPKRGDLDAIGESMEVNGFFGAVLAQESTGYILAGNHTFRKAVQKGAESIPTIWVEVDDEHALRILLADNKTAELGHMDEEALEAALAALPSLEGTGYGLMAVEALEEREEPESEPGVPTADEVPDDDHESQWGVVLMCTSEEDQRELFEFLQSTSSVHVVGREIRVVAI